MQRREGDSVLLDENLYARVYRLKHLHCRLCSLKYHVFVVFLGLFLDSYRDPSPFGSSGVWENEAAGLVWDVVGGNMSVGYTFVRALAK